MKKTRVTIDPDIRSEHEPFFRVPKSSKYEPYGLRLLSRSGAFKNAKPKASKPSPSAAQRVTVKARVVKMKAQKGVRNLRAHIGYLERSGTALDGNNPEFFGSDPAIASDELRDWVKEWGDDLHHFRFIISPENGSEIPLELFVKQVMERVQKSVGCKLKWFSACHYNTDNPHAHVVMRGAKEDGTALFLPRDFISQGIRDIASQVATIHLGGRDLQDIQASIGKVIEERRLTFIDRELLSQGTGDAEKQVSIRPLSDCKNEFERNRRNTYLGRLEFLSTLGLAEKLTDRDWKLGDGIEGFLRHLGNVEDARKAIHRAQPDASIPNDLLVYGRKSQINSEIIGKVISRVTKDELSDEQALFVSDTEGRSHFIPIGSFAEPEGFPARKGEVVLIRPQGPRVADRVISEFSSEAPSSKGLIFDLSKFTDIVAQRHAVGRWKIPEDLSIADYCSRFKERIESLEKSGLAVKNEGDSWVLPTDFLEKVEELERKLGGNQLRVKVVRLSSLSLFEQTQAEGPTWLDSQVEKGFAGSRGFGEEVNSALKLRKEVLLSRGIDPNSRYRDALYSSCLARQCAAISSHGSICRPAHEREKVIGTLEAYLRVGDIDHLLVRHGKELILAPQSSGASRFREGTRLQFEFVGKPNQCSKRGFFRTSDFVAARSKGRSKENER